MSCSSDLMRPRRALLSVSDKSGLIPFATFLHQRQVVLLSTGGTARCLQDAGLPVTDVSDYTEMPEMMDGRVKTLHPAIHGGILAQRDKDHHAADMQTHNILPIDLVIVNLYPFADTVHSGANSETCIENIDIGGPAMIRAAAKNHGHVGVLVDPDQYEQVQTMLIQHDNALPFRLRQQLAARAYAYTAAYDAMVARWFASHAALTSQQDQQQVSEPVLNTGPDTIPDTLQVTASRTCSLRYGENPHQQAGVFLDPLFLRPGVGQAQQVQGKDLSFNNMSDTDAAFELVAEFDPHAGPACAIIKHGNPCGVAVAASQIEAYHKALRCDPVSAFGGIVAFNTPLEPETAQAVSQIFTEVIIAPHISRDAIQKLAHKKNLRVLGAGGLPDPRASGLKIQTIAGGYLVQTRDTGTITADDLTVVTHRVPSTEEVRDMLFAFRVCKHVKSNAIIYAKDTCTTGIGAGQMSRVDSSRIAVWKAHEALRQATEPEAQAGLGCGGSVVASDAFFPFEDALHAAADAGATAVIQPGGSKRDPEIIAAADARGLAMVLTHMRHFRH